MDENRFSPSQLIVGLAGLAVAIWALVGMPDVSDSGVLGWCAIGVAVVIGVAMIVVGSVAGREH